MSASRARGLLRPLRSAIAACVFTTTLFTTTLITSQALAIAGPPLVESQSADTIGATVATLRARIDPAGYDANYYFEYGKTTSYGSIAPAAGADIGSGTNGVGVGQTVGGLQPDATYHYRVVATSSQGATAGEDQTFSTFGVGTFDATVTGRGGSAKLQAGSHPDQVTMRLVLAQYEAAGTSLPAGAIKDLNVNLPTGLIGNPSAVPQCPQSMLSGELSGASNCPRDTQIGIVTIDGLGLGAFNLPLYDVKPEGGVPAQFGLYAQVFPLTMNATVQLENHYALTVELKNVSQLLPMKSVTVTLWGVPADPSHNPYRGTCLVEKGSLSSNGSCPSGAVPEPFMTLPTVCGGPLSFTASADSWAQLGTRVAVAALGKDEAGEDVELTGCERLDFNARIAVRPDTTSADSPAGLSIDLSTPQSEPGGLAQQSLRDVVVTLPRGMSIDVAAADGLSGCTLAQIGLETSEKASCPESSKIGGAEIDTPLLPVPLIGSIYLAQPGDSPFGGEFGAYLVAGAQGIVVKLPIELVADRDTGQLTVKVNEAPQVEFTDIKLNFKGGPRAVLATPDACGAFATDGQASSYTEMSAGLRPIATSDFMIDANCNGGFSPSFTAGSLSAGAGESTALTVQVGRPDGQQQITSMAVTLPQGLLAKLSGVPLCGAAQAVGGTCPATSRIGAATVGAGAGSDPFHLLGEVFVTEGYGGAPFGVSIVVPAVAGPFDLGTVVIRARLLIDPRTARLTLATDSLPTILDGIPLRIRSIDVAIDRAGFISNPTNCAPQQVNGLLSSARASSQISVPFAVTGCARLPFSPRVSASTEARVSREDGASLSLRIQEPPGVHANIRSVKAVLPVQLSTRLGTVQQACLSASFESNPASCPKGSRIGSGAARSSLLSSRLSGPMYLVSNGRRGLPEFAIVLQGQGVTLELIGYVDVARGGAMIVEFNAVPDAPISNLLIALPQGPESALGANELSTATGSLCGKRLVLHTTLTAQNGLRSKRSTTLAVRGCRSRRAAKR
jgi:hypothetical protein